MWSPFSFSGLSQQVAVRSRAFVWGLVGRLVFLSGRRPFVCYVLQSQLGEVLGVLDGLHLAPPDPNDPTGTLRNGLFFRDAVYAKQRLTDANCIIITRTVMLYMVPCSWQGFRHAFRGRRYL